MITEDELEIKLKELNVDPDDLWEFCQAMEPFLNLLKKYKQKYSKEYIQKMLGLVVEIINQMNDEV